MLQFLPHASRQMPAANLSLACQKYVTSMLATVPTKSPWQYSAQKYFTHIPSNPPDTVPPSDPDNPLPGRDSANNLAVPFSIGSSERQAVICKDNLLCQK